MCLNHKKTRDTISTLTLRYKDKRKLDFECMTSSSDQNESDENINDYVKNA